MALSAAHLQQGAALYGTAASGSAPPPPSPPPLPQETVVQARPNNAGTYSHFARGVTRTAQVANVCEGATAGFLGTAVLAALAGTCAPLLVAGGAAVLGGYAALKLGNYVGNKMAQRAGVQGKDPEVARAAGQATVTVGLAACTGGWGAVAGWGVIEAAGGLVNRFRHRHDN
ncbi:MAG TPA: hypothetical protein VGO93_12820 [Candidatus Xenobia bacterium]|jgi:hypothetical protein